MLKLIFFCLLSYLMGSISSAIIICRLKGLPDPRTSGSKNPGATNILRIGGKATAAWVLLGDILKGALPVALAKIFGLEGFGLALVALMAVIGHIFPVFFGFKGGKGIATAFGALLALTWITALALGATWIVITYITRYSSLAGIIATFLAPFYTYALSNPQYLPSIVILSLLILFRHRENIVRLAKGEEEKVKF